MEHINTGKSPQDIDREILKLNIEKNMLLDSQMASSDPDEIVKAINYVSTKSRSGHDSMKSYLFSPEDEFFTGLGYKSSTKTLTYDMLRRMGSTPIINSVISTRIEQLQNFSGFTLDDQKEGWTIRRKLSRFDRLSGKSEVRDSDKRVIEQLVDFLENGGLNKKFDLEDDLDDYIRKGTRDSLELDQMCTEYERNNFNQLIGYSAVDSATMRLLETIDPNKRNQYDFGDAVRDGKPYKPTYAQVYRQKILTNPTTGEPIVYYPWELSFMIRNKSSDIHNNGYGKSELEVLIEVITWTLWGMQYNGNFFKQGSHPKGFFTIEGATDQTMLNEFRNAWRQTMAGVQNAHKVPVFEGQKINWVDMMHSNKDMEFKNWNQFLILMTCSAFRIDPSELGFHFKEQSQVFGQQGQKERLDHSKDKGLKPLLRMHQKNINKYIISELNPQFEFTFTGIDLEDEEQRIKNVDAALRAGITSFEKQFENFEGEPYDAKKHTILNQVFQQAQQAKLYGGEGMNAMVDGDSGGENIGTQNPFDQYEKSLEDPILKASKDYIMRMTHLQE